MLNHIPISVVQYTLCKIAYLKVQHIKYNYINKCSLYNSVPKIITALLYLPRIDVEMLLCKCSNSTNKVNFIYSFLGRSS